jgi:hypothetical protein
MTLKEMCALLLAGGMGIGGTVAVQQAKAPGKPAASRPAQAAAKPARPRPAAPRAAIEDCPLVVVPRLSPLPEMAANPMTPFAGSLPAPAALPSPPGGGGGGNPLPPDLLPPGAAPIPEPAAWAMLVSGFGLVGLALRRRPRDETA